MIHNLSNLTFVISDFSFVYFMLQRKEYHFIFFLSYISIYRFWDTYICTFKKKNNVRRDFSIFCRKHTMTV